MEGLRGGGGLDGSAPGEQCPWGASHRLSSDPGAPAEAEGASVLWIHTGWAVPPPTARPGFQQGARGVLLLQERAQQ